MSSTASGSTPSSAQRLHQLGDALGVRAAANVELSAGVMRTVGLLHGPTPLTCPGVTLFCKGRSTFLLDNDGRLVHEWKTDRNGSVAYLKDDGNLIRLGQAPRFTGSSPRDETKWNDIWSFAGGSGFIQELAWDGTLVWEYSCASFEHLAHHDCEVPSPYNMYGIDA